jgi:beta-lactamase regulating signal transducer with metallopeptidase domain
MPVLFVYILKLSITLAVVYLFYHFVLRKLTFYTWNRWYLLGYSLLSFFIAFFNITPLFQNGFVSYNKTLQFVPSIDFYSGDISMGKNAVGIGQSNWNNWSLCLFIVATGAVVLSLRLIIQYFSFLNIRRKAELLSESETKIYHVEADIIPFSFGNSIFINKQLHSLEELQEIVCHEFVHVKQKHSIDILWSELLCIACWYNPFSWLLKRSIRQNLEFIADSKVLEGGMNKKEYQYLLLKVIGNNHFSIASKFNFSSLKKRIAMMNKMKTARMHIVKFLFILPLVAVLLIAFRKKEHEANSTRSQLRNESRTITLSSVSAVNDTIPKAKAGKKQIENRASDHFEITDKKAMIHLRNGKTEEYDLTDSLQRRNFEANYGKIISVAANVDELAPVSVITESAETIELSHPTVEATITPVSVTTSPVAITTANGETVIIAKPATAVKTSIATVIAPATPTKGVAVVDDNGSVITGEEEVLVTITKNTTVRQLEDLKKQMKDKGYELSFDTPTYYNDGILTHISGAIKSRDGQSNFSASDFEKLILAKVRVNYRTYLRVNIVDKKKSKVVI